jgi:RHS repeat-associated protein
VGGLLCTSIGGTKYYPLYDGNGNICQYLDGSGGFAAHYEYSPFGHLHNTPGTGSTPVSFNFRFSTKFNDSETDFYYYGYRYYSSWMARWINRDPIGEEGGANLYGMLKNNTIAKIDYLGLMMQWLNQDVHANITWNDGTVAKVRNPAELVSALRAKRGGNCGGGPNNNCVKSFHVMGHGARTGMQLGPDHTLQSGGVLGSQNKYSLEVVDNKTGITTPLTKEFNFCKDASLVLDGCNTARRWPWEDPTDSSNLAKEVSTAFPGVGVYGNRGLGVGILALKENVYGASRCYKNGIEQ